MADKTARDAATDQALAALRDMPRGPLADAFAASLAGTLAAQFPGTPGLGRIVVSLTQSMSTLLVEGIPPLIVVAAAAFAGQRLDAAEREGGRG